MPKIRPISDLRNNFAEISRIVHDDSEPVYLTKNGYGDMVVMSVELYEKLGITALLIEKEAAESAAMEEKSDSKGASAAELKIQKPLSKWQKTLSDLVSH